jgi:hypothetical protein
MSSSTSDWPHANNSRFTAFTFNDIRMLFHVDPGSIFRPQPSILLYAKNSVLLLQSSDPMTKILDFLQQLQRQCSTSQIETEIRLQALHNTHAAQAVARKMPMGLILSDWLNHALFNQCQYSLSRLATGAAEFTQGELGAFFNNDTG